MAPPDALPHEVCVDLWESVVLSLSPNAAEPRALAERVASGEVGAPRLWLDLFVTAAIQAPHLASTEDIRRATGISRSRVARSKRRVITEFRKDRDAARNPEVRH